MRGFGDTLTPAPWGWLGDNLCYQYLLYLLSFSKDMKEGHFPELNTKLSRVNRTQIILASLKHN